MHSRTTALIASSLLALAACGDNNSAPVTIQGTVSGLAGTGLVLQNNGGDDLAITAAGGFTFSKPVMAGSAYAVTVIAQPKTPAQVCTVTGGTGTAKAGQPDIAVSCTTSTFTVGGTVTGLSGIGLAIRDNGGDALTIDANGTFMFPTALASGGPFAVTVATQPSGPTQTCTVSGGTGTIGNGNVTTVVIDCAVDRFTIGGQVSGLAGSVILQNGGGDDITLTANGTFAFPTTVESGATYAVTVASQPTTPSQTCVVTAGSGSVTSGNVTSVLVACTTNQFAIGGTVVGLVGTGLVLQNNGTDDHAIAADGTFTFTTSIDSGATFAVTVGAQPTAPSQTCVVTGGTGTVGAGDVTTVTVNCTTDRFTIGGTVTGLSGKVVLQDNGGDDIEVTSNGTFAFPVMVDSGAGYDVTVLTDPTSPIKQTCTVTAASGTVDSANITDVAVVCTTDVFQVGGTVTGLASGESVVLRNNGADDLTVGSDGSFTFPIGVASGSTYSVTVATDPASPIAETCVVANASATIGSADVSDVTVTCAATPFTVHVTVTGLSGSFPVVLQNNGADDLIMTADGTGDFATTVASGGSYSVSVKTQPTDRVCTITAASGIVAGTDVTVAVNCSATCFTFTNTAAEDLTNNNWFDACATTTGTTLTFTLTDTSGTVVYQQSGAKVGTWSPYDFLTSTDATSYGSYNEQFDSANHDRMIVLGNGDHVMIPGRWAANEGCGGSLGDGYGIVIYPSTASYYNNIKLMVQPYRQVNYDAGSPRAFPYWTADDEITYNGGNAMNSCTALTPFEGTFTVTIAP